ncbi:Pantothenate transporter liz1 [Vanrija pseudolonga]|uniref:Pantothenate transporter liz1 n=1 Tax=Vanrija pseudolonga TaxID=143232 RepID=A0AAF0Y9E5_9TREE|nr:Pantothenate transporter liz1 [Vanrija pseudolonga]
MGSELDVVKAEPAPPTSTWKGKIWDTFDLPPEERKLLFKVDAVILTLASVGYFLKNLDQANVTNAFLSGMKEDLGMLGNELVTANTLYTVGYVIGQVPCNLLLTRVPARYVLPAVSLLPSAGGTDESWNSDGECAPSHATPSKTLYALRFLIGLFESGFYPGIHYILGGWYTSREIGKRSVIFWVAGGSGPMFSGYLQAAAFKNLNGVNGLAGWRWMFIIDAIVTLPVAVASFFFLPGLPLQDAKDWWLTEEEHELAKERMLRAGRKGKEPWTRAKLVTLFTSWKTYMMPMLYVLWNNGFGQNPMGFWLKSFNSKTNPPVPGRTYTVPQINTYPTITTALWITGGLVFAWLSDGPFKGRRWPFIYIGAFITLAWVISLRQIPLYGSIKTHYALYWLLQSGGGAGALILAWINEASEDTETRAILVAWANDLAYIMQCIGPLFYWKTTDFPAAKKGYASQIGLQCVLVAWTTAVLWLLRRDKLKGLKVRADDEGSDARDEQSSDGVNEDLKV